MVKNFRIPYNAGRFPSSCTTGDSSRSARPHSVMPDLGPLSDDYKQYFSVMWCSAVMVLFTLMKQALGSSETSVLTRATRRNIREDTILHSHRRDDLKSYDLLPLPLLMFKHTTSLRSSRSLCGPCRITGAQAISLSLYLVLSLLLLSKL
jgi:hypothetical protein